MAVVDRTLRAHDLRTSTHRDKSEAETGRPGCPQLERFRPARPGPLRRERWSSAFRRLRPYPGRSPSPSVLSVERVEPLADPLVVAAQRVRDHRNVPSVPGQHDDPARSIQSVRACLAPALLWTLPSSAPSDVGRATATSVQQLAPEKPESAPGTTPTTPNRNPAAASLCASCQGRHGHREEWAHRMVIQGDR